MTFSVNPVRHVATAIKNVMSPKVAWIGTSAALQPAVLALQHNRIRKLKNPTTIYKQNQKEKKSKSLEFILNSSFNVIHNAVECVRLSTDQMLMCVDGIKYDFTFYGSAYTAGLHPTYKRLYDMSYYYDIQATCRPNSPMVVSPIHEWRL